jgi:hypothetical protein
VRGSASRAARTRPRAARSRASARQLRERHHRETQLAVETSAAATPIAGRPSRDVADGAIEVVARAVEQIVGERDAGRDRLHHFARTIPFATLGSSTCSQIATR